jgi:uncharacterized surface anchored protein
MMSKLSAAWKSVRKPTWRLIIIGSLSFFVIAALLLVYVLWMPKVNVMAAKSAQQKAQVAVSEEPTKAAPVTDKAIAGGGDLLDPPAAATGGTCISGNIIDIYHNEIGAGWEITITPVDPTGAPTTITADEDGYFSLNDLGAGTYTVEIAVPEGYLPFTPSSFDVTLDGDSTKCADVRFKMEALGCLIVKKQDVNGKLGFENKVGIPGWLITASLEDTVLSNVTDGEGTVKFANIIPGEWTISEEQKVGWTEANGQDTTKTFEVVSPRKAGACQTTSFTNQQVHDACIRVYKENTDGDRLSGWDMTLSRDDGTRANITKTTDDNGAATFNHLALGDWTITETVKKWYRAVEGESVAVTLETPSTDCTEVTIINEPLGCVDGYKINQFDQGLRNWTITASNADTQESFIQTSDSKGYFKFMDLTLGSWTITETLQDGWTPVTPPEFVVNVDKAFTCEHVRFKNRTDFACVDVYKRDAHDKVGLPGWLIDLQPAFGNGENSQSGTTDGTGWIRFNQLVPGVYTISETAQDGWEPVGKDHTTVELKATGTCKVVEFFNKQTQ